MKKKNFVLFGAAGYVAPKHLKAIKETGNNLIASYDVSDSVGIIDSYFPNSKFFTNESKIVKFIEKSNLSKKNKIDYLVICTPNYLHESQIRLGLKSNLDVICEKPLCLNPKNLFLIKKIESKTKKKCYPILQLRLHPQIIDLRKNINKKKNIIDLVYITPRGQWYYQSWKGQEDKSGGIESNIGIHFFDMLLWIYGKCKSFKVIYRDQTRSHGILELNKATVKWYLSIDGNDLKKIKSKNKSHRILKANGQEVNFTDGFDKLHTTTYKKIISKKSFLIDDTIESIELVHKIRKAKQYGNIKDVEKYIKNLF